MSLSLNGFLENETNETDLRFKAALPFLFSTEPALPQEEVLQALANPMSAEALQYLYASGGLCCDSLASKMQGPSSAEHRRRAAVRNIFFLVYMASSGGNIRPDIMEILCKDAVRTMYNSMLSGIEKIDSFLETKESRRLFLDMVKGYFFVAFHTDSLSSFESDFRFFPLLSQYLDCSLSFHNDVGIFLDGILPPDSFVPLVQHLMARGQRNVHFAFACFYSFCCFKDSPERLGLSKYTEHLNNKVTVFTFAFPALQTLFSTSSGRLPIVFPQLVEGCLTILDNIKHLNFFGTIVLLKSFSRLLPSLLDLNVVDSESKREIACKTFKIAAQLLSTSVLSPSDPSLLPLLPKALDIIVDSSHLPAMLDRQFPTYRLTEGAFAFVTLLLADPATRHRFPRLVMQSGVNFPAFVRSLRSMTHKVISQGPNPATRPVFALTPRWIEFFSSLLFVCGTPADHEHLRRSGLTYEIYPYYSVFCPITNGDFSEDIPWLSSIAGGHYVCAAINRPSIRPTLELLPQSFHRNINFLDVAATHAVFVSEQLKATRTQRTLSALELSVWADHLRTLHRVCRAIFLLLQPDKRGVRALRRLGVSEEGAMRRFGVDLRKPQTPASLGAGSRLTEFRLRAEAGRTMQFLQRVQGEIAQCTREYVSWIR